ncbi:MAG: twin-arginine translocation signal domain-containing protein [Gammaproteobacteria bacterium]|nr:MAG: twin-arginine translocation signal domain-containing protein [Gammaproteobacteria bacterium]
MRDNHLTRRHFLRNLAVAGSASSVFMLDPAIAQDLPKLSLDDPLAVGLQYVEDATASSSPAYKAGSTCDNCLQIQGPAGDAFRRCAIVPGKLVAAAGWCSAWVAMP